MVQNKVKNYQVIKEGLDDVLLKLRDENVDVDEAIDLYKKGQGLIIEMENYLKTAKNEIKEIKKTYKKK